MINILAKLNAAIRKAKDRTGDLDGWRYTMTMADAVGIMSRIKSVIKSRDSYRADNYKQQKYAGQQKQEVDRQAGEIRELKASGTAWDRQVKAAFLIQRFLRRELEEAKEIVHFERCTGHTIDQCDMAKEALSLDLVGAEKRVDLMENKIKLADQLAKAAEAFAMSGTPADQKEMDVATNNYGKGKVPLP